MAQQSLNNQQSVNDFVASWNQTHTDTKFAVVMAPVIERPVSIEVRFAADKYIKFISEHEYDVLKTKVSSMSDGIMFVASDYYLFARGIIEIKVAMACKGYTTVKVAKTLTWLGDKFFPKSE